MNDYHSCSALPDFRRFMHAAYLRMGQLVNQTELGRDVPLPQPTVHRWLNLLETASLWVRLPAFDLLACRNTRIERAELSDRRTSIFDEV